MKILAETHPSVSATVAGASMFSFASVFSPVKPTKQLKVRYQSKSGEMKREKQEIESISVLRNLI